MRVRRWMTRVAWTLAAAAVALLGLVSGLRLALDGAANRGRIRAKVEAKLSERLGEVEVGDEVSVGWLGTVTLGPVHVKASRAGEPPVLVVERVVVRPRWSALFSGRVEPGRVRLKTVRLRTGVEGVELAALGQRVLAARSERKPKAQESSEEAEELELEVPFDDVKLKWERAEGAPIELGPVGGEARILRRPGTDTRLGLLLRLPERGGRMELEVTHAREQTEALVAFRKVQAKELSALVGAELPVVAEGGVIEGELQLASRSGGRVGRLGGALQLAGLVASGARLAFEPVGPLHLAAEGSLEWDLGERRLRLEAKRLALGEQTPVEGSLRFDATLERDPTFSFQARAPRVDYAALVAALPPSLVPEPRARLSGGSFSFQLGASGRLRAPEDWELEAKLDLSGLKERGRASQVAKLRGEFVHTATTKDGATKEVVVGPSNPRFVSVAELPKRVTSAVLLSEDAAFWTHQGIDFDGLRYSVVRNATAGKVVRGGSTLTQQLAKNLFLSREKTLARKAKEVLAAVALEASLPKERLLEIYLNIAEWGPGFFGLGEAARHYFGKPAAALSPKEAAFLATILPNPVRFHAYCWKGELSEAWEERVATLLGKMVATGVIDEASYDEAMATRLQFAQPERQHATSER